MNVVKMNILKQFQEQSPDKEYRTYEDHREIGWVSFSIDVIQVRLTWGPFWRWKIIASVNTDYISIEEFAACGFVI